MDAVIGMTAAEAVAEVRLVASEAGIAVEAQRSDDSAETLVVADNDAGSGR
jgi:hypothetical protein